jgi:hypothetical protein
MLWDSEKSIWGRGRLAVNADLVARATERQWSSISSNNTSLVSSIPKATIAKLSPTNIMSIPAASATCALGKSWAVSTVIGSAFLYMDRKVPSVIFFREVPDTPIGECELHLACKADKQGLAIITPGLPIRDMEAHGLANEDERYMGT